MLEDPITELSIAMEIDHFQLNRAEYFVPIVVKIPGRELALAKRGGAEHTLIDFVGEIKDLVGGTTVTNVRDNVNIKLSDATAAELAHRPIEYDTGFTLLPGKYMIKFLARDDETGRIGTYQTTFVIPNLNKEDKRVPISSVVLSSQRVGTEKGALRCGQGQGSRERRCRQSAGAGRQKADSQRDARLQSESRHLRLSTGLQAAPSCRIRQPADGASASHATADGIRDVVREWRGGPEDAAHRSFSKRRDAPGHNPSKFQP